MSNLYFKNNQMRCLLKRISDLKMLLLIFMLSLGVLGYSFAQTAVYFDPGNLYPILNTNINTYGSDLKIDANNVTSYGVDIYDESIKDGQKHPNDKLLVKTLYEVSLPGSMAVNNEGDINTRSLNSDRYSVFQYAGIGGANETFSSQRVGQLNFMNTGTLVGAQYLTSAYVSVFNLTDSNHASMIALNGGAAQPYDSISGLNIYFWGAPAVADTVDPTFPNNAETSTDNPNFPNSQVNRQSKSDFDWTFELLDAENPTSNNNGWIADPGDFKDGTNFRPNATHGTDGSITNQDGINSGSFALQVFIATGWDNSTAQNAWDSWKQENTYTNIHGDITLVGQDKTWRWFDKNYSGDINESNISDFGVEELVMVSGYVEDRNMYPAANGVEGSASDWTWDDIKGYSPHNSNNSTNFVYYFNQGMRPWFNQDTQGSYTHNVNCELDIVQSQNGFVIRTITGFLHDDWAGIDTGSVKVIVTGTVNGSVVSNEYTEGANLSLTNFSFSTAGCRVSSVDTDSCVVGEDSPNDVDCGNTTETSSDGFTQVCNDAANNTGGYGLVFSDNAISYDPEDEIYVSIQYKDNKGKDGRPVSCDWGVEKAPRFVGTGDGLTESRFETYFEGLMNLSNHPNGAQVSEMNVQLQDDWAGVDSSTIVGSISGKTLNGGLNAVDPANASLNYNGTIYTPRGNAALWNFDNYPHVTDQGYVKTLLNTESPSGYRNWLGVPTIDIHAFQALNYELLFGQTGANSDFTDYFAPEHDINLNLTFADKDGIDVYNPIDVDYSNSEKPEFWNHTGITDYTNSNGNFAEINDTEIGNYLTGEMAKLFSGNMASGENRIFPYDLTGDNYTEVDVNNLKQTDLAFRVTDNWAGVDSGTIKVTLSGQRRGSGFTYVFTSAFADFDFEAFARGDSWANELNFLAELKNHGIYFDRQSRGSDGPVEGRESRYTITLEADDFKQPTANSDIVSFTRDMENLSCKKLDRCNARLYFTYDYGTGLVPVVQTGVHPFLGQTLYVIASGSQVIYTGVDENYIACNGAGELGAPLDIEFDAGLLVGGENDPYNDYQYSELLVKDGNFELSGNVLILK